MNPTPLDRYDWGYCRPCQSEVAVKPRSDKDIGDVVLVWHGGSFVGGACTGSGQKPWLNPGGEVKQAAFADPSKLPTIPCEVY